MDSLKENNIEIKDHKHLPSSGVSQRAIKLDLKILKDETDTFPHNVNLDIQNEKEFMQEVLIVSPKSCEVPVANIGRSGRLSNQSSTIEVIDNRKNLRDALYQGIFHRHRKTIFAVGSFLRMLRSRNAQYNTIRSSSGEDVNDLS